MCGATAHVRSRLSLFGGIFLSMVGMILRRCLVAGARPLKQQCSGRHNENRAYPVGVTLVPHVSGTGVFCR